MTMLLSGPLASLAHLARGCSVQERPTAPPGRPLADPGSTDMADLARTHAHAGCCTAASRQPAILNGRRSGPLQGFSIRVVLLDVFDQADMSWLPPHHLASQF